MNLCQSSFCIIFFRKPAVHLYPKYQYDTLPESDIIVRGRQNTSLPVLRHVSSRDYQPYLPDDLVRSKRGATADEGKIWPNGIIPYMIDGTFPGILHNKSIISSFWVEGVGELGDAKG